MLKRLIRWMAAGSVVLTVATVPQAVGGPRVLVPLVVWIPQEYHTGGAYTALQAGPDGSVYLGTTFYDGFARFLVLPPGGREFRLIADMGSATGETVPGPHSQAKIHTKPVIASDGRVYFATKSGKPARDARWQAHFPGGHLLAYDPRTGKVTDLGIPRARQSIIALGIDRTRGIIYLLTDPEGHLITYDPTTRSFSDRGTLAYTPQPTRYLPVMANGDVFHPAGPQHFMRYDAASGAIERIPLQFSGHGVYERSSINDGPYAMTTTATERRFYGVGQLTGQVYTFTSGTQALMVQFHGSVSLEDGGSTEYYTMTTGPDGNVYYTATLRGGLADETLYVLRLVTGRSQLEVLGKVGPLPPPPPFVRGRTGRVMVQGSTTGPDGTLYIMLAYPLRILVFPRLAAP